jgi:hypothetical protein
MICYVLGCVWVRFDTICRPKGVGFKFELLLLPGKKKLEEQ